MVDLGYCVRFCKIGSIVLRRKTHDACARSLCDQWGGNPFFFLVYGPNFFPKSLIDSGFRNTPKSSSVNPCEGSVHKLIFLGILRYFRNWFPCSTMLALLNASKIIFFLNTMSKKSSKYIDDFLGGKSLLWEPVGELKKVVFRVHPYGQKWHIRKRFMNLANFWPFLSPKYLKMPFFTIPSVILSHGPADDAEPEKFGFSGKIYPAI